jgi:hypothetical protein
MKRYLDGTHLVGNLSLLVLLLVHKWEVLYYWLLPTVILVSVEYAHYYWNMTTAELDCVETLGYNVVHLHIKTKWKSPVPGASMVYLQIPHLDRHFKPFSTVADANGFHLFIKVQ